MSSDLKAPQPRRSEKLQTSELGRQPVLYGPLVIHCASLSYLQISTISVVKFSYLGFGNGADSFGKPSWIEGRLSSTFVCVSNVLMELGLIYSNFLMSVR